MAFPTNPTNLQTHIEYGRTYRYFTATGTWLATRGDWDYVESELDLSLITGTSPVTLGNGATYTPITVPYVVTNRVWQVTEYDPPEIPVPTVAITGTTGNLIESSTRSFVVYLTDDHDNIASLNIVSGGGSLSSNSISNGNSVIYTPTNVTSNTSVTLRATAADIRGATVTSDMTFTVADTPAATVGISGNTNFMEANSSRAFTVSQSGDLDGNIQVSITSGQGTLSHSSRTNGQSVTYTNPSYYQGGVTIRARGINYDGEITNATVSFSTAATNPTVSISGSTSQLAYGSSRSFTANHTRDSNNSIAISVVSGGGSLNKSSVSNGGSFNYSGGSHSGAVTIRATAVNYAGETATANKSFSVATSGPNLSNMSSFPNGANHTFTVANSTGTINISSLDDDDFVVAYLVGGGGGGAAGVGTCSGNVYGGGGGGASIKAYRKGDLGNTLTYTVGAGGSGSTVLGYAGTASTLTSQVSGNNWTAAGGGGALSYYYQGVCSGNSGGGGAGQFLWPDSNGNASTTQGAGTSAGITNITHSLYGVAGRTGTYAGGVAGAWGGSADGNNNIPHSVPSTYAGNAGKGGRPANNGTAGFIRIWYPV